MCGCVEDAEGIGIRQSWIPWWFIKHHSDPGATLSPWQHSPWQHGLVGFCIFYILRTSLKDRPELLVCTDLYCRSCITHLKTILFFPKNGTNWFFWSQMFCLLETLMCSPATCTAEQPVACPSVLFYFHIKISVAHGYLT